MFAAQAASAMENDRHTRALRRKLVNRDVIGEASAMLMQRFEIDAPTAFLLLLRLSEITKTGSSRLPAACSPGIPDTVRLRRRDVGHRKVAPEEPNRSHHRGNYLRELAERGYVETHCCMPGGRITNRTAPRDV